MTDFGRWPNVNGEDMRYSKMNSIHVRVFGSRVVVENAQDFRSRFFYDAILRSSMNYR